MVRFLHFEMQRLLEGSAFSELGVNDTALTRGNTVNKGNNLHQLYII